MDLNVRAFRTVQAALSDAPLNKRKQASRKSGIAGGRARADALSADRKKEIALAASAARWANRRSDESAPDRKERQ
jgi:hypothetical protein